MFCILGKLLVAVWRVGRGWGVDTLEPHSHSLNLCYVSYSSDHTLSQLTWRLLMYCYCMPIPFVTEIACVLKQKAVLWACSGMRCRQQTP